MTLYNVIIRVLYVSTPYTIKIKYSNNEFWVYPGNIIEEINDLENLILFNEENIDAYKSYSVNEFLKKDPNTYCYIAFKMNFNVNKSLEDLILQIQNEVMYLIMVLDYYMVNFHYFDKIYIFQMDNKLVRAIKLNFNQQWFISSHVALNYNKIKNLEEFLVLTVQNFEKNYIYLDDFELFLRGKLYIEPTLFQVKKGKRNILDNLSDIWESMEHISNTYWKKNNKKFNIIKKNDPRASSKVSKIKYMFKSLSIKIDQSEEAIIQDIYKNQYNYKKHETADLQNINFQKLGENLMAVLPIFEKAFTSLLGIYPNIIKFKLFRKYIITIEPTDERKDFSTRSGIKKKRELLSKNDEFIKFIQYIQYEPIQSKLQKYPFEKLKSGDIEKPISINSIDNESITFTVYDKEIDIDKIAPFGGIIEFCYSKDYSLKVIPDRRMEYPNRTEKTITIKFFTKYFDLLIK